MRVARFSYCLVGFDQVLPERLPVGRPLFPYPLAACKRFPWCFLGPVGDSQLEVLGAAFPGECSKKTQGPACCSSSSMASAFFPPFTDFLCFVVLCARILDCNNEDMRHWGYSVMEELEV